MSTSEWLDQSFVAHWTAADTLGEFLATPRRMVATIVGADRPVYLVIDIGSGPGDFLAIMLEAFPRARGVWSDVSPAMAERARDNLARFGDRVSFRTADMLDLAALPAPADLIVTSRASHHLDPASLAAFYADAAKHLAPGGWLANLDHVRSPGPWEQRLRAARRQLIPPAANPSPHRHPNPLPTVTEHVTALAAAGLTDAEIPWRGLYTCLFLARRDG